MLDNLNLIFSDFARAPWFFSTQVDAGDVPMEAGDAVAALESAEAGAIARALELPKKSKERKLTKALTVFAERYQLLTPQRQLQPASFQRIFKDDA
jgi:hypothetical protein